MTDQNYKLVPVEPTGKTTDQQLIESDRKAFEDWAVSKRWYKQAGKSAHLQRRGDGYAWYRANDRWVVWRSAVQCERLRAAAPEPVISDAMCDAALNVVTGEVDGALFPDAYSNEEIRDARRWMHKALSAAFDATPEPVCKWTFVGIGFDSECGWHVEPSHSEYPHDSPYPFCPHCGRKTEVVGDE